MKNILRMIRSTPESAADSPESVQVTDAGIALPKHAEGRATLIWAGAPSRLADSYRQAFEIDTSSLTIGAEEELILLDPQSLLPENGVERVLSRFEGDDRVTCELRQAQIEIITPTCTTAGEVCRELSAIRALISRTLSPELRIAAVGTHPSSTAPIAITERARYLGIAADCPWATLRGLPSGLHIHIAVRGSERALAVYNTLRSYLPEIAALAANSPFFEGTDTGLASTRLKLNEALSRSGVPPAFSSWEDLAGFVAWASRGGLFPDPSYLWWDLRLHPVHGTLEIRVADAQTRIADSGGLAAFCQALVASLVTRYDAGEELPVHDSHRIRENVWRAIRYGLDGELVDLQTGRAEPARERVGHLLDELEPFGEVLRSTDELAAAWALLEANGADRQRGLVALAGIDGLLQWLADETEGRPTRFASSTASGGFDLPEAAASS